MDTYTWKWGNAEAHNIFRGPVARTTTVCRSLQERSILHLHPICISLIIIIIIIIVSLSLSVYFHIDMLLFSCTEITLQTTIQSTSALYIFSSARVSCWQMADSANQHFPSAAAMLLERHIPHRASGQPSLSLVVSSWRPMSLPWTGYWPPFHEMVFFVALVGQPPAAPQFVSHGGDEKRGHS